MFRTLVALSILVLVALSASAYLSESDSAAPNKITAAFYYGWFPNAWEQQGISPYSYFEPTLGFYNSQNTEVIDQQVHDAKDVGIDAFITSWWGPGHSTDIALSIALPRTNEVKWAVYHEQEGQRDPPASELASDIQYLNDNYFSQSGYLRVNNKPVMFIFNNLDSSGQDVNNRWEEAQNISGIDVYLVLKVYEGFRTTTNQPEAWHQYGPSTAYHDFSSCPSDCGTAGQGSINVSPGFFKADESTPRLERSLDRFEADMDRMRSSQAFWQLVTSWNEWGEGTGIEPQRTAYSIVNDRSSPSTPTPTTTPTPIATPEPGDTLTFYPTDDATIRKSRPDRNYGLDSKLEVDANSTKDFLLRFEITGVGNAEIDNAIIRLLNIDSSSFGGEFFAVSDNEWNQETITWNNAPVGDGVSLGSFARVRSGNSYNLDVTSFISGDGVISLRATSPYSNGADYSSLEGATDPQLIITLVGAVPSVTPTPIPGEGFSFAAGGDHGDENAATASLISLAGDSDLNFYLALGDMSYNANETAWCNYVKGIVGNEFPFQLVAGNHEDDTGDSDGFIDNFSACLPDRLNSIGDYGHQYYFDYPAPNPIARIIMADVDLQRNGSTQEYCRNDTTNCNWLRTRIQEAKSQNLWVIVGMHKVCLSIGNKDCAINQEIVDMMIEEKVDLVLQAHDHDYQRSHSLSCAQAGVFISSCVVDNGDDGIYAMNAGTVFVINGAFGRGLTPINTGDSEFDYFPAWAGGDGTNTGVSRANGYTKYTVTNNSIIATFIPTSGGDYTDTFVIR